MLRIYSKIFKTSRPTIPLKEISSDVEINKIGSQIHTKVKKLFRGSLAIREVDAGSTNSEEQELIALSNPYYDVERFGFHFVASPRHADMLLVTGPVTRNMAEALRRTYEAMPNPKIVVAVGDGAINGGIFRGSYAIYDSVSQVIPVNYAIPGDPPAPSVILKGLLAILGLIDSK